jgi:hypothetical protein
MQSDGKQINLGGCFIAGIVIFVISMVTKLPIIAIVAVILFIFLVKKNKISFDSTPKPTKGDQNLSQAFEDWMQKRKTDYDQSVDNRQHQPRNITPKQKIETREVKPVEPLMEMQERVENVYVEELKREPETQPVEKQEMDGLQQDWSILPGSTSGKKRKKARVSSPTKKMYHGRQARKAAFIKKTKSKAPTCSACRGTVPANASYCMHCGAGFR